MRVTDELLVCTRAQCTDVGSTDPKGVIDGIRYGGTWLQPLAAFVSDLRNMFALMMVDWQEARLKNTEIT
ncbi:unnamed protein product [Taenia asiatica]|uniref:Reverse transcriptase domain-containing protein n=1 Tax=Taenia asiatica TaxID=60517 RepID=A0A0R3VXH1_TAEAS|nr:unnamed protein product [Taenia asiatica]